MGTEQTGDQGKIPLRMAAPAVYDSLMQTLDDLHVQPYDVKADAVKEDNGLLLTVRFGEEFRQTLTHFFTYESLKKMDDEVTVFFKEIKEACHKALMSEYFQTMNPLKDKFD